MEFCRDGVLYSPKEHDEAQRAIACIHELQKRTQNGKSTNVDKVTGFNTNTDSEATVEAEGGK